MGSSSRKYGCEYMYTDIQLSDWCVCPRVCPNTYYFTTHISYEKEKCSQALALALECRDSATTLLRTNVDRGSWIVEHGPNPTDYPRASTNVGA